MSYRFCLTVLENARYRVDIFSVTKSTRRRGGRDFRIFRGKITGERERLDESVDVSVRRGAVQFTGCSVSLSYEIKTGPSATISRGIRLVFPFERKFKYTALLFHERTKRGTEAKRGERAVPRCAFPVAEQRKNHTMGTLIERFAHVPWNPWNLLRRLTMYRDGT